MERKLIAIHAVAHDLSDVVIVGRDAALLHGIPLLGRIETDVSILSRRSGGSRRRNGLVERRFAQPLLLDIIDGIVTTSIVDTVLDIARTSRDPRAGIIALDHTLHRVERAGGDPEAMRAALDARRREFGGGRGTASAKRLIAFADAGAESPLESISRLVIEQAGLPTPVLQKTWRLADGRQARTDFYFEQADVVGEADGMEKYSLGPGPRDEAILNSTQAEKERDELLRACGSRTTHWTWLDAWTVSPLLRKLRLAGVRPR
ncbi:hypothetical protein HQQ80_10175 [Microbacteriaceae bacterium VKM Ac-2855]|nr:hypothetical protein [Microbacteriaceae bacterium VKM Ac-2855]